MSVRRSRALAFIFVTILLDVIGFGVIIPVLPKLISELGHENLVHAAQDGAWLLFTFALAQFIFSPILGGLSDKYGRRPVLLISLFGFGLDYIFMAFAPTLGWLFVGRAIAGITGASFTTASAYIADVSEPEKRAQNFGLIGAAFGLGFIIGPALGGLVGSHFGIRAPFALAAILCFINFAYGYFVLPESLLPEHRRAFNWKRANPVGSLLQLRKYPVVSGLVISLVLLYIAAHAVQSNWAYYTMFRFGWSEATVGMSLAVVGLLIGLVQGVIIRYLNPKIGAKKSVYIGMSLYAFGLVLFAFADTSWLMFLFLLPYCLGGIAGPALQGIISSQVPKNEQGELQGGLTSLMAVTSIVGPLLMNNLFYFFSQQSAPLYFPGAAFIAGAILVIIATLFAATTLRRRYIVADGPHAPSDI